MFRTKPTPTQQAQESVKDAWAEATSSAKDATESTKHAAASAKEAARSTLFDTMLPKVGAVLGAAAAALAERADEAKESAAPRLEHARDAVRESAHEGETRARDAYHVLRGEAVAKPARGGKGKWLIGIGLAAAAVAAVAAFRRRQQAEDPWATTPVGSSTTRSPHSSAVSTPVVAPGQAPSMKDRASEKVGVTVEHAMEAMTGTAAKAKEKASDLAAKGRSAVTEAKDHSGEAADSQPRDPSGIPTGRTDRADGQVTAVDATLGSDAIDDSVLGDERRG